MVDLYELNEFSLIYVNLRDKRVDKKLFYVIVNMKCTLLKVCTLTGLKGGDAMLITRMGEIEPGRSNDSF